MSMGNTATATAVHIKYPAILRTARFLVRRLPALAGIDANDLAHEQVVAELNGRKSRIGPMQDALRKQGWMKQHRNGGETFLPTRVRLDERTFTSAAGHSLENRLVAKLDIELLLNRLTPYQRQAVELHHLAGMTETEMSKALAIPIQRVKNRIHHGIKNMRRGK